jgi:hypothetical protein
MNAPRWVLIVLGIAVLVAAIDVAVFVVTRKGPTAAADATVTRDRVAVIDPAKSRVVGNVPVGRTPTAIVAGYGAVWVLNRGDGTLTHIDAQTRKVVDTMQPDATANDLATGAGGIWFAGRPRGTRQRPLEIAELERIDPKTGAVDREFDTHTGATVIAAGGGALWSTGYLGGYVRGAARSDAVSGAMRRIELPIYGDLIASGGDAVYWIASIGNRVARVSTRTGRLTASIPLASDASVASGIVSPNPTDAVVGGGSVWISTTGGTVVQVDRRLRHVTASIPVCGNALAIAYGEGAVWVACASHEVVRVDPATGQVGSPIAIGGLPRGIAAGEGAVWVTLN